ncbi:hypothetical protein FKM82_001933 [Ascaphus truei]
MEVLCYLHISGQRCTAFRRILSTRLRLCRSAFHVSSSASKSECETWSKKAKSERQQRSISVKPSYSVPTSRCYFGKHKAVGKQWLFQNGTQGETSESFYNCLPSSNVSSAVLGTGGISFLAPNPPRSLQRHLSSRPFQTSSRLNVLLPPYMWLLIKPAQKLLAIIFGRGVRIWWRALPSNRRKLFKESLRRNKWKLFLGAGALGVVFILFYFTHLEESPITGRSRLLVFTKEHYDFFTQVEYEQLIEEFKDVILPEADPRHQLVQKIVDHLIACNSDLTEVSEIKWLVHVVQKSEINAFVLPNGQVFVFTGMLNAVADTHQLSFILGHELAHAVLEHMAEKASVSHVLDFLFLISLAMIWAICPLDSLAIVGQWIQSKLKKYMFDRPYSRTLEAEADRVGLQLAAKACVDVRASSVFWQQMEVSETMEGYPRIPEWLSTHPSHENRAEHLDRLMPEAIKLRERCNCPALSGPDPRLIFNRSVRRLLQTSRETEPNKQIADLVPIQVDDKVPRASAVKAI